MSFRNFLVFIFSLTFIMACDDVARFDFNNSDLNTGAGTGAWKPSVIPGLNSWIKSDGELFQDSGCTVAADQVSDSVGCWRGASFDFTTTGNRPTVENRNGRTGIYFSGNSSLESIVGASAVNGNTGFELIAVVQSDSVSQNRCFFDVENSDNRDDVLSLRYDSSGLNGGCTQCLKIGITTDQGTTQTESGSGIQSTDIQMLGASWSSGNSITTYERGVARVSHTTGVLSGNLRGANKLLIGDGSKRNWQGMVYEILYFERELSAAERDRITSYLVSKWVL